MPERGPQPAEAESARPAQSAPTPSAASRSDDGDREEPFELSRSDDPDREDPRVPPSRARTIVLSALLAVGLVGGAVLAWAGWQISSQKDATVTIPAAVAGLRLDNSQSGRDTADYLQSALVAEVDLDKSIGAVYTDGAGRNVLFFGGTALMWSPADDLESAFGLISDDQGAVTGVHDVTAGKYGGTMRCGTTKTADSAMSVCGWADHGSLAVAMFPDRSESESAKLLLQIRDSAQKRN
jgi:hypothetical protein